MLTRFHLFLNKEKIMAACRCQKKYWNSKLLLQNPLFVIGIFAFSLIPFFFACLLIKHRFADLSIKKSHFKQIKWQGRVLTEAHKTRDEFFNMYQKVDPNYLSHLTEKTIFLKSEIDLLNTICAQPALHAHPIIKHRLAHLTNGENRLVFVEQDHATSDLIKEVYYKQKTPVEVEKQDIKNLLSMIEGVTIGCLHPHLLRPQFVVRRFDLRRTSGWGPDSYLLEMDLIKREPT